MKLPFAVLLTWNYRITFMGGIIIPLKLNFLIFAKNHCTVELAVGNYKRAAWIKTYFFNSATPLALMPMGNPWIKKSNLTGGSWMTQQTCRYLAKHRENIDRRIRRNGSIGCHVTHFQMRQQMISYPFSFSSLSELNWLLCHRGPHFVPHPSIKQPHHDHAGFQGIQWMNTI